MTDQEQAQKGKAPQRPTGEFFAQDNPTTQLRIERTVVCPYCRASQHIEVGIDGVFCSGCKKFYQVENGRAVKFGDETVGRKCSSCGEVAQASPKAQMILCSCGSKCEFKGAEPLILNHVDCPNCSLSMPYEKDASKPIVCKKCGYDFVTCKMPESEPESQSPDLATVETPDDSADYLRAQLQATTDKIAELEDMIKKLAETKSGEEKHINDVMRRSDENLKLAQDTAEENSRLANEIADLKNKLQAVPNPADIENSRIEAEEKLKTLKSLMTENGNLEEEVASLKRSAQKTAVIEEALTSARQEIDQLKQALDEIPGLKTQLELAQKQANRVTELEATLTAKEKELQALVDKAEVGVTTELLQLRYEVPSLKAGLETAKSEKQAAQKAAEDLRHEVSRLKSKVTGLNEKYTEAEQKISGCEARIAQLDGERQEMVVEFNRASEVKEEEIQSLRAEIASRQADLNLAEARIKDDGEELAKQKEIIASMKKSLDSREGQIADLSATVAVLEEENRAGGKANLDLQEEIARLKTEIDLAHSGHKETFECLVGKQKELRAAQKSYEQDLLSRDEEIVRLGKKIDSLEVERSQFDERKSELVAQINSAQDALRNEKSKFSDLEIALKKAETEKSGNQAQINELTRNLRELREDYDRQVDQLKSLRENIQRAKDAEAEKQREVLTLTIERDGLISIKDQLAREVESLRKEIVENNLAIQALKKQAVDLEKAKDEAERKHQQEAEVRIRLNEKLDQLSTGMEELRTQKSALVDDCAVKDRELAGLRARAAIVEAQAKSNKEESARLERFFTEIKKREEDFEKNFNNALDAEKVRLHSDLQDFKAEILRQNEQQIADAVRAAIGYKEGELDARTRILDKRQSEVEKLSEQLKITRAERDEFERDKAKFKRLVADEVDKLSAVELSKLGATYEQSKATMLEKLNSSLIAGFSKSLDLKEKLKFAALGGMVVFIISLFFILLS
jgi:hypothetical protein